MRRAEYYLRIKYNEDSKALLHICPPTHKEDYLYSSLLILNSLAFLGAPVVSQTIPLMEQPYRVVYAAMFSS